MTTPLLELENLVIEAQDKNQVLELVRGISLKVQEQQKVGILGESGSGKSLTALSILRLLPQPRVQVRQGKFFWRGQDFADFPAGFFERSFRWKKVSIAFQETSLAFNPTMSLGQQFFELFTDKKQAAEKIENSLQLFGFPDPKAVLASYPHLLSGGMKQRLMFALALTLQPELLITDEPTSAIDSVLQKRMIDLVEGLVAGNKMSWLVLSHDLNLVGKVCDYIYIFYAGKVMEHGESKRIFDRPRHPYTYGLLRASYNLESKQKRTFFAIPGQAPRPEEKIQGCPFHSRCSSAKPICQEQSPSLTEPPEGGGYACFFPL